MDLSKPYVIKSTIPLIDYHRIIHNANPTKEIVTLHFIPVVLWKNDASFKPFVTNLARKTFGLGAHTFTKVESNSRLVPDFTDGIHVSVQTNMLHMMNLRFLKHIYSKLSRNGNSAVAVDCINADGEILLDQGLQVDNLYLRCRSVVTLDSTGKIYGDREPSFLIQYWLLLTKFQTFEVDSILPALYFPSITMPKAYRARSKLQFIMAEYFTPEHDLNDPSTAQLVMNLGLIKAILPTAAVINTVPVAEITPNDDGYASRTATFNITDFDTKSPLLIIYDVPDFNPKRVLKGPEGKTPASMEADRNRKDAYFPFGGGLHLWITSLILLGYDIEPVGTGLGDIGMRLAVLVSGAVKPKNRGIGLGGKILRRKRWEYAWWYIECR
ncbi:hypothetical protein BKA56DRAFT_635087 [Ilyonectria sp. MPI-CAGE-AT-0026]|nr:hypothetical protein BKA56DRAFT_635087 [Ilyonectria sp. MPI-CAGE-AT-0026]